MHGSLKTSGRTAIAIAVTSICVSLQAQNAAAPRGECPCQTTAMTAWGSFQMEPLLRKWESAFVRLHPEASFNNELHSTLTATAGLYTGVAQLGVLGRDMWPEERAAFRSATGEDPVEVEVATGSYDVPKAAYALGIFVNTKNPATRFTQEQLEAIFRADGTVAASTWGQIGLRGRWSARTIHIYSFDLENDKSRFFARIVMHGSHRWNPELREFQNDPATGADAGNLILKALVGDPAGIAISNPHYIQPGVKLVAVGTKDGRFVRLTRESVADRSYPLARSVYLLARRGPDGRLRKNVALFLKFALSPAGQSLITEEGEYLPLPPLRARANAERLH